VNRSVPPYLDILLPLMFTPIWLLVGVIELVPNRPLSSWSFSSKRVEYVALEKHRVPILPNAP